MTKKIFFQECTEKMFLTRTFLVDPVKWQQTSIFLSPALPRILFLLHGACSFKVTELAQDVKLTSDSLETVVVINKIFNKDNSFIKVSLHAFLLKNAYKTYSLLFFVWDFLKPFPITVKVIIWKSGDPVSITHAIPKLHIKRVANVREEEKSPT